MTNLQEVPDALVPMVIYIFLFLYVKTVFFKFISFIVRRCFRSLFERSTNYKENSLQGIFKDIE